MRQYGEGGSVGNAKLAIDAVQVDLHSPLGESKPLRYFLVGYTLGEHERDLPLAGREWLMRPMSQFCIFLTSRCSIGSLLMPPSPNQWR